MRSYKPWWWWMTLAGTVFVLVAIALSFRWIFGWSDSAYSVYVYFEHGMLCCNPNSRPPGAPAVLPWYGMFEIYRSSIYEPWRILPDISLSDPVYWSLKIPLHLTLLVLLPLTIYPLLPPVVRRNRRKRGLCGKCEYDLTGLSERRCPECGMEIEDQ